MFYKAILRTGNKTIETIKQEAVDGKWVGEFTDKDAESLVKFFNLLDGLFVIVGVSEGGFTLISWDSDSEQKMKEALYIAEQDEYFGTYIDDRERFEIDWESGEYHSDASIVFSKDEVEIIRKIL